MNELDKLENHIKENKPEEFIRNCFCCIKPDFTEVCKIGRVEIAKWMIKHGFDASYCDSELEIASEYGKSEIVELLLEAGANVHVGDDYPLRWASMNGHFEVVKVLLEGGADVHAEDDWALRWASEKGHTEVVKLLKEHIERIKN